jgi:hypothetical protein
MELLHGFVLTCGGLYTSGIKIERFEYLKLLINFIIHTEMLILLFGMKLKLDYSKFNGFKMILFIEIFDTTHWTFTFLEFNMIQQNILLYVIFVIFKMIFF